MAQRKLSVGFCATREGLYLSELLNYVNLDRGSVTYVPLLTCRKTLYAGAFFEMSLRELESYVASARTPLTIRELMQIFELPSEVLRGVSSADLDFPLRKTSDRTAALLGLLAANDCFRAHVKAWSEAWRSRLVTHVKQRLGLAGVKSVPTMKELALHVAFIDVGWSGHSQLQLQKILQDADMNIVFEGLYVANDDFTRKALLKGASISGWLCACGDRGLLTRLIVDNKEILELACTNNVGAVVDYDVDGEAIHQDSRPITTVQIAEQEELRSGIALFVVEYFKRWRSTPYFQTHPLREATAAIKTLVARAIAYPSREEVAGIGAWIYEEGGHFGHAEQLCDAQLLPVIEYATVRQLYSDVGAYWLLGFLHLHRSWAVNRAVLLGASHSEGDERHIKFIGAQLMVERHIRPYLSERHELAANAFVEADGRALSFNLLFSNAPLVLTWAGPTHIRYVIDRIEIHCRYTDGERELVQKKLSGDEISLRPNGVGSDQPVVYRGQQIPIQADFLSNSRPREIATYVCLRAI